MRVQKSACAAYLPRELVLRPVARAATPAKIALLVSRALEHVVETAKSRSAYRRSVGVYVTLAYQFLDRGSTPARARRVLEDCVRVRLGLRVQHGRKRLAANDTRTVSGLASKAARCTPKASRTFLPRRALACAVVRRPPPRCARECRGQCVASRSICTCAPQAAPVRSALVRGDLVRLQLHRRRNRSRHWRRRGSGD
jgi:hypothetical protein